MRCLLVAAVGALAACPASSTPAVDVDAQAPDASSLDAASDAPRPADAAADATETEASVTEIVLAAASFPIADGAVLDCGAGYDGVVVFYAAASDPSPTETGFVSCASPVVVAPVEPGVTYDLDVYLQQGTTVVAQATCTATAIAGQSVAPSCSSFM